MVSSPTRLYSTHKIWSQFSIKYHRHTTNNNCQNKSNHKMKRRSPRSKAKTRNLRSLKSSSSHSRRSSTNSDIVGTFYTFINKHTINLSFLFFLFLRIFQNFMHDLCRVSLTGNEQKR